MLDVLEANELLERAEELRVSGRYDDLNALILSVPNHSLIKEQDLGYYSAVISYKAGNFVVALAKVQRTLRTLPCFENTLLRRRLTNLAGIILVDLGRLHDAQAEFMRTSAMASAAQDLVMTANTTMNLGVIADIRCEWDQAIAAFSRACVMFESLASVRLVAGSHHNLGMSFREKGLFACACAHLDHALEGYSNHGSASDIVAAQSERALVVSLNGDGIHAKRSAEAALKKALALGSQRLIGECMRVLGRVCIAKGEHGVGKEYLERALPIARDAHMRILLGEILEELAVLELTRGDKMTGNAYLIRCEQIYSTIGAQSRISRARARCLGVCPGNA